MSDPNDPIRYEYDFHPEIGEAVDILPGLKWLRLPLPFMLGHINVWLLEDGDGWAIVDTGIYSGATRKAWENVFSGALNKASIARVLVTHLHPDHAGCAGWLCEVHDVDLYMPRDEYLLCRILVSDTGLPAPKEGRRFYREAGFVEEQMSHYIEMFGGFGKVVGQLPRSYHRLHEDQPVQIGEHEWQIITGHGHSPEHACLYNPQQNVLISGDQILPTISPNVSVYPTEPAANPLAGWFDSLHRMKALLPDDVLVLPSHGKPFRGVKGRLDALIEEHEVGLEKLRAFCCAPQRAVDVFPALFKSRITDSNLMMATGEAIAHLNYLLYEGEVGINTDEQGARWYQTR
ncbi:MAG: MBL fold metallo-hydrolase [Xanthomonadales bacterium]|nr:MBL fold metallo-hydrolase [Xanthomonadales bacterium]